MYILSLTLSCFLLYVHVDVDHGSHDKKNQVQKSLWWRSSVLMSMVKYGCVIKPKSDGEVSMVMAKYRCLTLIMIP